MCLGLVPRARSHFSMHIPFTGATSNRDTQDILYARQKIVVIAKAFGLQAIDLVYIDFRDGDGLLKQSREAAAMGFTGMMPGAVLSVYISKHPRKKRCLLTT